MTGHWKTVGFASVLVTGLVAAALALPATPRDNAVGEGQAVETDLGANVSALTYWVKMPAGWHVVTTVDAVTDRGGEAERHAVVRFSALLSPGQSQLISVPAAAGNRRPALRIRRTGDRIEVARVADPDA